MCYLLSTYIVQLEPLLRGISVHFSQHYCNTLLSAIFILCVHVTVTSYTEHCGKCVLDKMAAPAVRGLLTGCRTLSQVSVRVSVRTVGRFSSIFNSLAKRTSDNTSWHQCSSFHSSAARRGLEEFFDDPKNWGESTVKSGDAWTINQLRCKSSEDLHKLWYVLLKEKNMLNTLEQESKRQRTAMPSPERLYKVTKSMENLHQVVTEREDALRLLQTGQENARPGEWRKDCFGETTWYKCKEWPIPWYMNRRYKTKKFFALPYVDHYARLKLEKEMRAETRRKNAARDRQHKLEKKFPHIAKKILT
ncbi:large ribosomal subunit protein uL29m [Rhinoderma darwinii]|uniref:large ribosomal subunit protein uL29m n=1 Tax=Rhinoderma darwinii TaxID=43563 RepID=UPI003F678671